MLRTAVAPTGKAYGTLCKNAEATKRFENYYKRNDGVKKYIRKWRMRYWTYHQIEDEPPITI